jgi:hypothetical protein
MKTRLLMGFALLLGVSCENDPPDPPEPIQVIGTVGPELRQQAGPNSVSQALGLRIPNTVAAIPIVDGPPQSYAEAPIASDGTFALPIDTSNDTLLVLADSTAPPQEKVVAYIAVGDGDESMIAYPVTAAESDVLVGTLNPLFAPGAAHGGEIADIAPSFSISLGEMTAIAETDNVYLSIVNNYINFTPATGDRPAVFYRGLTHWGFNAPLDALDDDVPTFQSAGYMMDVNSNDDRLRNLSLCDGANTATLTPPAEVRTYGGHVYDPEDPLSTGDGVAGEGDLPYCNAYDLAINDDGGGNMSILFGGEPFVELVDGPWLLHVDGELLAAFELGFADPAPGGVPQVPVPRPRVELGPGNLIERVDIDWVRHRSTPGGVVAEPISDLSAMERVLLDVTLNVELGFNLEIVEYGLADKTEPSITRAEMGRDWHLGADPAVDPDAAAGLTVTYRVNGSVFSFTYGPPRFGGVSTVDLFIEDVRVEGAVAGCAPAFISVVVGNAGSQAVGIENGWLGSDDDRLVAADPSGTITIRPGLTETILMKFTPDTPVASGEVDAGLVVDQFDDIPGELNEDNNGGSVSFSYDFTPGDVDLVVESAEVGPAPTERCEVDGDCGAGNTCVQLTCIQPPCFNICQDPDGQSISLGTGLRVVLRNDGADDAIVCPGFPLWRAQAPSGDVVENVSGVFAILHTIPAGATLTSTVHLLPEGDPTVGVFPLTVTADPENALAETDETNNTLNTTIVVGELADLSVGAILVEDYTPGCAPGFVDIEVRNDGVAVSAAASDLVAVSNPRLTLAAPDEVIVLPAGASELVRFDFAHAPPFALEDIQFTVTVNPGGAVQEFDGGNNVGGGGFLAGADSVGRDLVIDSIDLTPSPAYLTSRVTANVTLRNQGTAAAALCPGETAIDVLLNGENTPLVLTEGLVVGAGQTSVVAGEILNPGPLGQAGLAEGDHAVTAQVDPDGSTPEENTSNNSAAATLSISAFDLPDLVITDVIEERSHPTCAPTAFLITVTNVGFGIAPAIVTSAHPRLQSPPTNGTIIDPGEFDTLRASVGGVEPLSDGELIELTINADGFVTEASTDNNVVSHPVAATPTRASITADLTLDTLQTGIVREDDLFTRTVLVGNAGPSTVVICRGDIEVESFTDEHGSIGVQPLLSGNPAPGETLGFTNGGTAFFLSPGPHTLRAEVRILRTELIVDPNPDNNSREIAFTVLPVE